MPNGRTKGAGEKCTACLRCGKPGHFARHRPEPFRQNLAMENGVIRRKGKWGGGKDKGKSAYFTESESPTPDNGDLDFPIGGGIGLPDLVPSEGEGNPSNVDHWRAYYFQYVPTEARLPFYARQADTDTISPRHDQLGKIWRAKTPLPAPRPILIDSGESGPVVGTRRLHRWIGHQSPTLRRSIATLRFGGGGRNRKAEFRRIYRPGR